MKPLGTITMCFPHIDSSTKTILSSIMKDAENYADFCKRLCERVCSQASSPLMEYLAFFFSFNISEYYLIDQLVESGKVTKMAEPLYLIVKYRRGEAEDLLKMNRALISALKAAPNDWIATQIYLKWRFYAELNFPTSDTTMRVIERIDQRVNTRKELEFFKSYLLRIKEIQLMFDFRTDEEIRIGKEILRIAREYDDQVSVADMLSVLSGNIKFTDPVEALRLLNSSLELAEKLGYHYRVGHYYMDLGHLLGQRYEFDAAIKNLLKFRRMRLSLGLSVIIVDTLLSFYWNLIGNGEEALKRIDLVYKSSQSLRMTSSFAIAMRTYALINLGKLKEARAELDASKELASRSGVAWYRFLWYQMVEGILEKEECNFEIAMSLLKDVLSYQEEQPVPIIHTVCLLNLTEIELAMMVDESLDKPSDSSGPWMQKLEDYVYENGVPGVVAQLLLLKAMFFKKQGRYNDVKKLLAEVKTISASPGLKYLENVVATKFPHIFVK